MIMEVKDMTTTQARTRKSDKRKVSATGTDPGLLELLDRMANNESSPSDHAGAIDMASITEDHHKCAAALMLIRVCEVGEHEASRMPSEALPLLP